MTENTQTIELSCAYDDMRAEYAEIIKGFMSATVPGFRPGRVPPSIIEGRFKKQIIEQIVGVLGRKLFNEAAEKEGLEPAGAISFSDYTFKKKDGFKCIVSYEAMPEFDMPVYNDIVLPERPADDEDDEARTDAISDELLDRCNAPLIDSMLKEELEEGQDEDQEEAAKRARLLLILRKIAAKEGISVDDETMEKRIQLLSEQTGMPANMLRAELLRRDGLRRVRLYLLAEKTLEFLVELNEKK